MRNSTPSPGRARTLRAALVLLTLLAFARASYAQPGSDPCPCLGMVCFTVDEAKEVGDTLWSRLDDREKRRLAHIIIARLNEQAAGYERDMDRVQAQIAPLMASEASAREGERLAKDDALMWKTKAKGRGGRGVLIGFPLGAAATYGGLKLFGVIR